MKRWTKIIEKILRDKKHKNRWNAFALVISCVVVFLTTYSLILPAITMEQEKAREKAGFDLLIDEVNGSDEAGSADGTVIVNDSDDLLSDEDPGAIEIKDSGDLLSADSSDDLLIDDLGAYGQPDDELVIHDELADHGTVNGSMTAGNIIDDNVHDGNVPEDTMAEDLLLDLAGITRKAKKQVTVAGYIPQDIPVSDVEEAESIFEDESEEELSVLMEEGIGVDSALEEEAEILYEEQTEESETISEELRKDADEKEAEDAGETVYEEGTEETVETVYEAGTEEAVESVYEEGTEEAAETVFEEIPEDYTDRFPRKISRKKQSPHLPGLHVFSQQQFQISK